MQQYPWDPRLQVELAYNSPQIDDSEFSGLKGFICPSSSNVKVKRKKKRENRVHRRNYFPPDLYWVKKGKNKEKRGR